MVQYEDLISRADGAWFQDWIDSSIIRVVQSLSQDILPTRVARQVFLDLLDPRELFSRPKSRGRLFELLRTSEAEQLAKALGLEGNPYKALESATVTTGTSRFEVLCAYFGVPPVSADGKESVSAPVTRAEARYKLFPHQQTAVAAVVDALGRRPSRVLLHMPTGAGKTRMAMHVICQRLARNMPGLVIWLANSEELCEQAAEEFLGAWRFLGNRDVELYRLWGSRSLDLSQVKEGLLVAGFAKTFSLAKQAPHQIAGLGDKTCLLVIDEAHQAIAPTYRLVIDGLSARHTNMPVLGLTATPGRTWNDPEADRQLAAYFERNKVSLKVPGFPSPIDFLINEGYLAAPCFRQIEHVSNVLTGRDLESLAEDLDVPREILRKLAADDRRTLKIVREVEDMVGKHARILLFATTVEHAIALSAVLRARGIESRAITAETPPLKRTAAITWYRESSPEPRVLTNFGVLTTGFDAPRTSAALIARPTKSLVLYSQMVGRAIRGPKAGGNADAEIVTVVDTSLPGFGSLAAAFNNWEDVW